MIFDHLDHWDFYKQTHPRFAAAFAYLLNFNPSTADGTYPLDGDHIIAHVQSYSTGAPETKQYESHREYLDLQYVAAGDEAVYVASLGDLTPTDEYDPEKDSIHYRGKDEQILHLRRGYFAVLYPQDGHKVRCISQSESAVKKVVLKIRI